ncbi:MAG: N-acetyltransferase [Sulfobacillus thermosulfidooxidans]|uniref:N-acetyltransferase n=2 Tax=Sulfobacillus thermosulfidooxidans TaxID=28034 RepID=A0A2T2X4W2_SULTH|nr:MAG: N-acetyltransferase [Sulfobacillus thermosulfidooxidans]
MKHLVEVYNSNPRFIATHLGRHKVRCQWLMDEIYSMNQAGFWSCKIINKASHHIIGLLEFKMGIESYLSLLMMHHNHAHQGLGQQIYQGMEDYVISHGTRSIRIDVVKGYDDGVTNFWLRNGFHVAYDISLTWENMSLPAVVMKKSV